MIQRDIYPYWSDVTSDIVERLELLSESEWDAVPCHAKGGSIRNIVIRMIRHERRWVSEIIQCRPTQSLSQSDVGTSQNLISELQATREATLHFLGGLSPEGLRAVRTVPGDPATNEVERNVPIAWIIWQVLEQELICWGQIQMRLSE